MLSARALLALMNVQSIGRAKAVQLAAGAKADTGFPRELAELVNSSSQSVKGVPHLTIPAAIASFEKADRSIEAAAKHHIKVIGLNDEYFPRRLRTIPDVPPVIFVKGDVCALDAITVVALIGTREPSEFGAKSAFRLGQRLALSQVPVVSGLALGCDAEGHRGCLSERGKAVAVLAHGLDNVYPAANRELASQILDQGGCFISEYPVGTKPQRSSFVDRDRLQSGLSDAVLVVETGTTGGSQHTIRFGEAQGRKIACVQHPPEYSHHEKAQGNAALIRQGRAMPIASHEDLLRFVAALSGAEDTARNKAHGGAGPELPRQRAFNF